MKPIEFSVIRSKASEVLGFEVEEFAESYTFDKEEIIDGEIITEEDLKDMNTEVMGLTSMLESKEICEHLGISYEPVIQIGVVDPDNGKAVFAFANEEMSKLFKKVSTDL